MDTSEKLSSVPNAAVDEETEEEGGAETGVTQTQTIPVDMYYSYEDLCSRPFITPNSNIPRDLLQLTHSFGYDCHRRNNLQLLDEQTLAFIAGNLLVLLDIQSKEQRYLRSCSGGGIGTIMAHPSKSYFAVAEKGYQPNIIIYAFPSLRPYRILRGGTVTAYSSVDFNHDGTLLASVGCASDFMLTLWDWVQERVLLRYKAFSQDVYRVTFSPYNPGQLTTSGSGHIKFWKMAKTFTGLKLQGLLGRFGKTALTDIDGYVELPDGKVVSGSEWGNMLLWEGGLIKVEICRKRGRQCHAGSIQQFALDEGELITIGTDGAVRTWDVECIDAADSPDDSGLFEMEPMNELLIGRTVCLTSMVKSSLPDSFIWFAQDANGSIWKLDLSFSNMTHDPERLFTFHAGAIQAMDVSTTSHLMATTALDRSVRIFDFLAKRELTTNQYSQGGTALIWAPRSINPRGAVLVVGFEDGVVRLLELYRSVSLQAVQGQSQTKDGELRLRQALKPHNAPVTAIAYECNGEILATGSADHTVFFFSVGDKYDPIGFVTVPGPVKSLEWSPKTHERNTLLILCHNGYIIEVEAPEAESHTPATTFEIHGLRTRYFHFHSIKSRIKRDIEVARRKELKEKRRKEKEQRKDDPTEEEKEEEGQEEEEKDELPALYIPESPSPLLCAFYSQPGAFWVSLGGYDAGFLYHCRFSEQQEEDPELRQDEPFAFLPLQETEENPICTFSFSSSRKFFLCGMWCGQIRVYPMQPQDPNMMSLDAFWALSLHDNHNGHLCSVRCSYDELFVLTTGEDGNIFVFSLLSQEELAEALEPSQAKIPSPPFGIEMEKVVPDILDTSAYSIETAKQRTELDRMRREAEQRKEERRRKLVELQSQFKQLLQCNQSLPEHIRLRQTELELDPRFREEAERLTAQQIREVQKELAWEAERHSIGLKKLQERFWESLESDIITVVACQSEHKISTYRLLPLSQRFLQLQKLGQLGRPRQCKKELSKENDMSSGGQDGSLDRAEKQRDDEIFSEGESQKPVGVAEGMGAHVADRLQKAAEKAERMKAKIERRRQEWVELFSSKPNENYEDPEDVRALQLAIENMGDFKLKTAKDFTVPEQLRMNTERKKLQLVALEEEIHERKLKMNVRIMTLRDEKMQLISQLGLWMEQLLAVQAQLTPDMRCQCPTLPTLQPEEIPERRLQYTRSTLQRFAALCAQWNQQRGAIERGPEEPSLLSLMQEDSDDPILPSRALQGSPAPPEPKPCELTELEEEMKQVQIIRFLYQQDELLSKMGEAMCRFDAELQILRHEKEALDVQMKLADLRHITLFQELLLLKDFEKRENLLQERLNARMQEESQILAKWEDSRKQLEFKQQSMVKLQQREKALHTSFQTSLGDNNKFADFLTKVFKKKVKRTKKSEKAGNEEEQEDSDEDSDEESDWDEMESDEESESGGPLDDSVCPPFCDPELFENTLQLRTRKLDLEELIAEEKKSCDALRKECDALAKKEKIVQSSLKAAEGDLELFDREKQQKLNELDVVVPLRLHQVEFLNNGVLPSDLSDSLVLNTKTLLSLQDRIRQLLVEKNDQGELYRQAKHRHYQLIHDRKDMETRIQELEERCEAMMMAKFGRLVDLEALQTLSGNRVVEELKHDSRIKDVQHTHELKHWKVKLTEAKQTLMEVSRQHTERVCTLTCLLKEKKNLEDQLDTRQRKMGAQFRDHRREEDERLRLQKAVASQAEEIETLRREITMLSHKGGHVLPPTQCLPSTYSNDRPHPPLRSGGAPGSLHSSRKGLD
ncbi:cilia- and flagella-associated protein 44 [Anguilla anguilla]|uniref:cilia- and flagella-associated protein 44 n=1 Tax=Anguilla anguilla TaxID=7936 RepID=UPI0015A7F6C4|nr:cilia- and flagella-associated protein 44 [Anguilla anguilla]